MNNVIMTYIYPPDFPILKALNELYNEITAFLYRLYPDDMKWPRWINIEIFRNDLRKNVYISLYNKIGGLLCINGRAKSDIDPIIDKMKTIILDDVELIFPFIAYNDDHYLTDTNIKDNKIYQHFNKELKISDVVLDYFRHSLQYLFDKYKQYNWDIERSVEILLFIRDYTYKSCLDV